MKWNNKKTGQYKSRAEDLVAKQLRRRRVKAMYEDTELEYIVIRKYIPDFTVTHNGRTIFVEVKGYLRPEDRGKMISVKKCNPNHDIRLVFMADNKLNKKSNSRYSDWATRHGFPYCIGKIPREWFS